MQLHQRISEVIRETALANQQIVAAVRQEAAGIDQVDTRLQASVSVYKTWSVQGDALQLPEHLASTEKSTGLVKGEMHNVR